MSAPGTQTTCPYCGVGCGIIATPQPDGSAAILGDPQHPANFGRLCAKGAALGETLSLQGRLLKPEVNGKPRRWDEALDEVARRFRQTLDEHGPESVAFYVSGQLLTEDYYAANKLMKGFIGSGNIDTNSRLCMSSSVAGHKRAFGEDIVPGCYADLELADLLVLVGSNTAWCHPVLYQRIAQAKKSKPTMKIVVIDSRRTAACELADLHLALKPGSDVALFNGLLHHLRRHDGLDYDFLERHVSGFAAALAAAASATIPATAAACGLDESDVAKFFQMFLSTPKTVTAWSQGVNQSSAGSDKVNAIINAHLATGRIGQPGMGPFSLTGQPNAMGGREVGGLANQLAAHMDFGNADHWQTVADFWRSPQLARQPGLKAVDLFQAIGEGRIKAVWIMATNPVVSLPDSQSVRRALAACPFVVVSDCEDATDLSAYAHARLPALAWGEKSGTVTNSERVISRQRPFLPPPGEARPDWWIICQVAQRLGFGAAFDYASPAAIFREHARLSACRNMGGRLFNIGALADLDEAGYESLAPTRWPLPSGNGTDAARLFGAGGFCHADGKARMLALTPKAPAQSPNVDYPLILNSGRIRDQWHTMTRTGRSPRLNRHLFEPYAELHPDDAARLGLRDGMLARLQSRFGVALARVTLNDGQKPGSVFMPMHWSGPYAEDALVNALVNPAVDPVSGEPESKHTPVRLSRYQPAWHGFLLAREKLAVAGMDWRVEVRGDGYWRYELAASDTPTAWTDWAKALLCQDGTDCEWLEYADAAQGRYRCAQLSDGRLSACLFVSRSAELPPRDWLAGLFAAAALNRQDRMGLLAGRAPGGEDPGRTVCACFGVGRNRIDRAIREQGCATVEQLGHALKAGSNCGACIPELQALLRETQILRGPA
ncbi:MAG: molybdopterin-dependent oxidoreductase [Candidatus Methylumidiphilus sp.]